MKFIYLSVMIVLLSIPVNADEEVFTSQQKEALGKVIDDHLMKNPEVLASALEHLQQKQMKEQMEKSKALIQKNAAQLFNNPDDYVAGDINSPVAMVVFLDPYCGHCRKFHSVITQALDTSTSSGIKELKIIFKDLPIFGDSSDLAVRAMLAAKSQGKYIDFQKEIFKQEKPVTKEEITKVAASLGLDKSRLLTDMESDRIKRMVASHRQLAETLGVGGTPTSIIGDLMIPGEISLENLKELVSKYRQSKDPSTSSKKS